MCIRDSSYDGNVYRVDAASAGFQRAGDRIDSTSGTEGTPTQVRVDVRGLDGVWLPTCLLYTSRCV